MQTSAFRPKRFQTTGVSDAPFPIGKWPQTVITGSAAKVIADDCQFIDSFVPNLVIKGIVLAYKRHMEEKAEAV